MASAKVRAVTSLGPPAANGTIILIGRDGYDSARTPCADVSNSNAEQTANWITRKRVSIASYARKKFALTHAGNVLAGEQSENE
jgi:hypothetical protein